MENSTPTVQELSDQETAPLHFVSFEVSRRRCVFGPFLSIQEAWHRCSLYSGERSLADNFCLIRCRLPQLWLVSEEKDNGDPCYHGPFVRQLDAVEFRTELKGGSRIHEILRDGNSVLMDGLPARLPDPPCLRKKNPAAGSVAIPA